MSASVRLAQISTIARLQLRRVFFSKRSFWVYLLAFFPAAVFFGHGNEVKLDQSRWASQVTPLELLESIREGDTDIAVIERAGQPARDFSHGGRGGDETQFRNMTYFDGSERWFLRFEAGILQGIGRRPLVNFEQDRTIYAAFFQYYFLRLAIFFGCLGIFMNLFRGEMLDKTLHYWFLLPARREVLLAGKYLAGLVASVMIFGTGAGLSFLLMLWPQDAAQASAFWSGPGMSHLFWYMASAALGCVGYGSIFLAAGLLLRNPIIPAIVILAWESINGILPAIFQKMSVLYYAQSLCPVPAPMDDGAPLLIRLLSAPAEPPTAAVAVLGLLVLTAVVLWAAARAVRRLEIDYGVD
jgi:ABC-type transport system involved in multi-copper enzyme maturation permease subunit